MIKNFTTANESGWRVLEAVGADPELLLKHPQITITLGLGKFVELKVGQWSSATEVTTNDAAINLANLFIVPPLNTITNMEIKIDLEIDCWITATYSQMLRLKDDE